MFALADAGTDAATGGKAALLAKLIAAGLPVPEGFVIAGDAIELGELGELGELTDLDGAGHTLAAVARRIDETTADADVMARAASVGDLLAVRSSATLEDGDLGAAAGVYASRRAVAAANVWAAIRAVWMSALTPLAIAYARRRGPVGMGVIVQRFVSGERLSVYTREPGVTAGEYGLVQRSASFERMPRDARDAAMQLALAAEAAIGAGESGADVELVRGGQLWIVQARPIVRVAPPAARVPPPPIVLAPLADGRRWKWDIAHNPDPLSPAQCALVALVADAAPWALRVCGGYLYTTARDAADAVAPIAAARDAAELAARGDVLEAAMAAALGPGEASSVADALARYAAFYVPWAEVVRLIAATRHALCAEHATATLVAWSARPSAVEATLLAAARGELSEAAAITRLAPLAPAWDVAVPTFGEQPGLIRDAIARAATAPRRTPVRAESPAAALAAAVADLAERDDLAFARAQQLVRHALLARAHELGLDADDVFWLPLADLAALDTPLDRDTAHRRASAARAAAARAARWDMPLSVGESVTFPTLAPPPLLRGVGHGAPTTGRVVRYAQLATAIAAGRGDIVVTRSITPALAVLVAGCAAIVSETGGLLDHGAALARELGIPCVVGCAGAWAQLADGDIVRVAGDAGSVTKL